MKWIVGTLALLMPLGLAQAVESNWAALNAIAPGQRIRVVQTNMKAVEGAFARLSDGEIEVAADGQTVKVARAGVMRVTTIGSGRGRRALKGAAIGAAAGVAVGLISMAVAGGADGLGALVIVGNGGFGAGIGAAVGALIPGGTTVYRAPR